MSSVEPQKSWAPSPPPLRPYRRLHRYRYLRFWLWELLAVVLSLGLVAAMTAILIHFDGQRLPEWPYSISLNTIVALLSTVLRGAVVMVAVEALGQARWLWIAEPRQLYDIHRFDHAGRSMFGSLALVGKVLVVAKVALMTGPPAGLLALMATLIGILSPAIGPFAQQAITTTACRQLVANGTVTLPVARYVPWPNGEPRDAKSYLKERELPRDRYLPMMDAMIHALVDSGGNSVPISPVCSTGNCSFPDYGTGVTHSSFGVCSTCIDTSDLIQVNVVRPDFLPAFNLSIPGYRQDGHWITSEYIGMAAPVPLRITQELVQRVNLGTWAAEVGELKNLNLMGLYVNILSLSDSPCRPPDPSQPGQTCPLNITMKTPYSTKATDAVAVSCGFYPCLRNLKASMQSGVLVERLVSTVPAMSLLRDAGGEDSHIGVLGEPCFLSDGTVYTYDNISTVPLIPGREFYNITYKPRNTDSPYQSVNAPSECVHRMRMSYWHSWISAGTSLFHDPTDDWWYRGIGCTGAGVDRMALGVAWGHNSFVDCGQQWWLGSLYNQRNASLATIWDAMERIAIGASNHFRVIGKWPDVPWTEEVVSNNITGLAWETAVCLSLNWRWLLYPYSLVALTGVLLVGVVVTSCIGPTTPAQPVWKASILPLILYGLRSPGGERSDEPPGGCRGADVTTDGHVQGGVMDLTGVNEAARATTVRFQRVGNEPGLVTVSRMSSARVTRAHVTGPDAALLDKNMRNRR